MIKKVYWLEEERERLIKLKGERGFLLGYEEEDLQSIERDLIDIELCLGEDV